MLVLASSSPRRRALLEQLGLKFVVRPADIDESAVWAPDADELVRRRAVAKGRAVECGPGEIVVSADTVVALGGRIFGKPVGGDAAAAMLRRLSGRGHQVWSGLAVRAGERERVVTVRTRVWMRELDGPSIAAYVRSGEPFGKAGAYAIQGLGAAFVTRVEGCYFNVVGLPISRLVDVLAEFGVRVPG